MELTTFRPYTIRNMVELFEIHEDHTQIYLVRLRFTENEYSSGSIDLDWHRLRLFIARTFFNLLIIVIVALVGSRYFPELEFLNETFEDLLQVKHIDMFWAMLCFTCAGIEQICLSTLWKVLNYRFHHSKLCFEYQSNLQGQLNAEDRHGLIRYFTIISYASGLFYKLSFLGLTYMLVYLYYFGFGYYASNLWNASQLVIHLLWILMLKVYLDYALALLFIMVVHLLLMLRVFKLKLHKCYLYVKSAKVLLRHHGLIFRFQKSYVALYREMSLYNSSINGYTAVLDSMMKFSVTMVLIFFSKQKHELVFFSYIIIFIFALLFLYVQYVYNRFSFFPQQNLVCFKHLSEWNARCQYDKLIRLAGDSFRCNQMSQIRLSLKLNLIAQAVGNSELGFTSGNDFFITKIKHLEMIAFNFFLLTLFYKKLSF